MKKSTPHARRIRAALAVLVLSTAAMTAGCKKDNREKIDLSEFESSTAAETMAPTSAPETTAAETDETAKESTAAGASKNVSAPLETYKNNSISVQYPTIVNLDDKEKASAVNEMLKTNALSFLKAYEIDETRDTADIRCDVISVNRNRITAVYTGTVLADGGAHPTEIFYTNTIDLNSQENLGFSFFADPYTMAGYVLSDDCTFHNVSPELETELKTYVKEQSLDSYTKLFQNADFPFTGAFPETFSYEEDGVFFFSIPVPHALGDYALVKYVPDNK